MTREQHQAAADPQTKPVIFGHEPYIQVVLYRLTITISRSPKQFVCNVVFNTCTEVVLKYKFKILEPGLEGHVYIHKLSQ